MNQRREWPPIINQVGVLLILAIINVNLCMFEMMDKLVSLPPQVVDIVVNKATEMPFSGSYYQSDTAGTYLCRRCGLALFRSSDKFLSSCGWPSFDDEQGEAIKRLPDADGRRTEILCQRCDAHLGHVFYGEGFTAKNQRHCVNSLAIDFVDSTTISDSEEAIVAGGCFWGVEHLFKKLDGAVKTEVGYCGDDIANPSYQLICSGGTEFIEAVRVIYDPAIINYQSIIQFFFEIHDPAQTKRQGPDIGYQYQSAIFYYDDKQLLIGQDLIEQLKQQGTHATTLLKPMQTFWAAEDYHQAYYQKNNKAPYCHTHSPRKW